MTDSSNFESRPLPETFVLELTRRCNHRCLHCYTVWGAPETRYPAASQAEMSTAQIRDVVARLQDETPVERIALSGGEPLLRDDLPEIVADIERRGITPLIITNGTLLTPEWVEATLVGGAYEVTLHSWRREVHDRLAGRCGAWEAAVEGMANICHAGGHLAVVFVATQLNAPDLFRTAELAIALGAEGLMYNRMNLSAHNIRLADQLLPTPAMIRENLDALDQISQKYDLPVAISVVIEPCVVDPREYPRIHFGWCPQAGEESYFTIDPAGNVRICNHSPTILGNILRDRFTDIYYHHPYVRRFRETWPAECESCDPELKQMCGGGCKAAAEQCYGTLERVDPFVTLFSRGKPQAQESA